VLLLAAGAAVLLWRRIIRWEIPAALFVVFALLAGVLGGVPAGDGFFRGGAVFHLLSGGLVLAVSTWPPIPSPRP